MSLLQSLIQLFGFGGEERNPSLPVSKPLPNNRVEDLFAITRDPAIPEKRVDTPPPLNLSDMVANPSPKKEIGPSGNLADFVANYEQFKPKAYQDSAGVWTVGYGTTRGVDQYSKMNEAQAKQRLSKDLGEASSAVKRLVKVPLTQNEYDAIVSLVYNVGPSAFAKSKALKALNAGDRNTFMDEAFHHKKGFVRAGGKINEGLQRRRADERAMFEKQAYNRTYKKFSDYT